MYSLSDDSLGDETLPIVKITLSWQLMDNMQWYLKQTDWLTEI